MKNLKQKVKDLPAQKKKNIVRITILVICIVGLLISFIPDVSPFFHQDTLSLINTIHSDKHDTTPVSYLKKTAPQDETVILNKPIQSTGCGLPLTIKTGTSTYIQISSNNAQRRFILYLPNDYKNTNPHSLLVVFHGYASNPFAMQQITRFNTLANKNNVIIVYPEGMTSLVRLRGWNTGVHPTITAKDVLFTSNMLNNLQANLCVNPDQIYATGFSNGGGFTAELACQLPDRIAAFAPVSGSYLPSLYSCSSNRPVPIIEFHGTKDTVVPYVGLKSKKEFAALTWIANWAKKDNCIPQPIITKDSKKITKYLWTGCNANVSVIHYKINGEGHSWPHALFKQRVNNNVVEQHAEQVIWNFFKQHPLPNSPTVSI